MVTKEAFKDPHKEVVGWGNSLGMTIGRAVVWPITSTLKNPELVMSEPYVMGSHATALVLGPVVRKTTHQMSINGATTA